ncbi:hypothetical protein [Nonomuraea typhae]|uniref:hypothetical protein n=1 Tax=Nonomuraea typhae TaxID=2603600 RepID=UPI0012F88A5F|nr:hypothetical protein [Nonomuraea typhae]
MSAIRAALATRLKTIPVLTVHTQVPDNIHPPAAVIMPGFEGEPCVRFDSTMARGSDEFLFTVSVYVQASDDTSSQVELDAYLEGSGSRSIKQVLETDASLGGTADFVRVREARNYGPTEWGGSGGTRYVGVDFGIEITA